ncbi:cyclin [Dictyostelium purpureum]|uniref:Cyclin n=1 Tax=Dictyostelium purpureum TaxID=5786 RepID=F0ZCU9_DICPU|nr:cyclin [Dictyostelium purpureum]EGC38223.1 cyclin [Dictyostelium purpureum]|eukprot:XP_003285261.1 cyclin [Dictyostelium purpureum]
MMMLKYTSILLLLINIIKAEEYVLCDDGNPCTSDFFDQISGTCQHMFNQWSGCENPMQQQQQPQCSENTCNRFKSNKCKTFTNCNMGQCMFRDVDCNDYNIFSIDRCDPEFGCHYTPSTSTRSCSHDYDCGDNMQCTRDTCVNGKCVNKISCGFDQLCNRYGNCESIPQEEIEDSPSRKDGISEEIEDNLRRYGTQCIQEAGILLKLSISTIGTGQVIFQRFYTRKSFKEYDVKTLSMGSLFVATKFIGPIRHIRDILNVFNHIWRKKEGLPIEYIDTTKQGYWDLKGDVIGGEFDILKEFGFLVYVDLPHKYILNYMKLLDKSKELAQKSWNYINDSMKTTIAIQYRPEAIAAASIFLASRVLKTNLPEEPHPWWELFETTKEEIEVISYEMYSLYSKKSAYFIDVFNPTQPSNLSSPQSTSNTTTTTTTTSS